VVLAVVFIFIEGNRQHQTVYAIAWLASIKGAFCQSSLSALCQNNYPKAGGVFNYTPPYRQILLLFILFSAICNLSLLITLHSLLNCSLQSLGVGADNLSDLLLALEDQECRHNADIKFLGDIWDFVNVELDKVSR